MSNLKAFMTLLVVGAFSVGIARCAEPTWLVMNDVREQIKSIPLPTVESEFDATTYEFKLQMLTNELNDLVNELRTQNDALTILQNRVWALENAKDEAAGKPRVQTWGNEKTSSTTKPRELVRTVRANKDGSLSETGPIVWRYYSDGTKGYTISPVAERSEPTVRYSQPRACVMPSDFGWSSGSMGVAWSGSS